MGRFTTEPFQPQAPVKPQSNGLGIAGFVFSMVGLLGCGLLSPVGVILSFIAVFREPRGLAIAGLVIGLVGSVELIVVLLIFGVMIMIAGAAVSSHGFAGLEATFEMIELGNSVRDHRQASGAYPATIDAVAGQHSPDDLTDPWGRAYVYTLQPDGSGFTLKSLGADGRPGTPDDLELNQAWLKQP